MTILEHAVRSAPGSQITGLMRHIVTRQEFRTAVAAGMYADARVELIEGEIIDMPPIGPTHAATNHPLAVLLDAAFGPGFSVRNQVPLALGDSHKPSEPQPDIAVAVGSWRDYVSRNPEAADVRLVVEIAESSLTDDRLVKAALYAGAGIPEYWIVNLIDRQLEIYREPRGAVYTVVTTHRRGEQVRAIHAAEKPLVVSEFMP